MRRPSSESPLYELPPMEYHLACCDVRSKVASTSGRKNAYVVLSYMSQIEFMVRLVGTWEAAENWTNLRRYAAFFNLISSDLFVFSISWRTALGQGETPHSP